MLINVDKKRKLLCKYVGHPTVVWLVMSAVLRITASVYPFDIFKYSRYII